MKIDNYLIERATVAAASIAKQCQGVQAVLIATADSFDVVAQVENKPLRARLLAVVSALGALNTLTGENCEFGVSTCIVIRTADGYITVNHIRRRDLTLILSVIIGNDVGMNKIMQKITKIAVSLE